MNCQLFDKYVFDYCEDQLSPALKEQMSKHLQECSRCRNHVRLTVLENEVLKDKSDLPILADNFTDRVMQHVQMPAINRKWLKLPMTRARNMTLAAAAVGLALVLVILGPHIMPSNQTTQVADTPPAGADRLADPSTKIQAGTEFPSTEESAKLPESSPNKEVAPIIVADNSLGLTEPNNDVIDQEVEGPMPSSVIPELYYTEDVDIANEVSDTFHWKSSGMQSSRQADNNGLIEGTDELISLPAPRQVPAGFILINTVNSYSNEGSTIQYHYTDNSKRSLVIALQSNDGKESILMNGQPAAAKVSSQAPESLEINYVINVDGKTYLVKIFGTLSAEELLQTAQEISFNRE